MISTRRKPFPIGQSTGVTLPGSMTISNEVSMAASDRLLLVDTTGEVPEDKLLEFYMRFIDPAFENWWDGEKRASASRKPKGFRVMQDAATAPSQAVKPPEPTIVKPEAQIQPVVCPRCAGQISWNIEQGLEGFCPYCGLFLRLMPG
jgi:hypothetical protein